MFYVCNNCGAAYTSEKYTELEMSYYNDDRFPEISVPKARICSRCGKEMSRKFF